MTLDDYIKQGSLKEKKKEIRKDLGENYTKERFIEVLNSARKDDETFHAFLEIIKEDNRQDILDAMAEEIKNKLTNKGNTDKEYIKVEKKDDKISLSFDKINTFRLVEVMSDIYLVSLDEALKKTGSNKWVCEFIKFSIDNVIEKLEEKKENIK